MHARRLLTASALAVLAVSALFVSTTAIAGAATYQLNGIGATCTEPGSSNTVHGNGFTAGASVDVLVGSTVVTSLTADNSGFGAVDGSFTVPSTFPPGNTTVELRGPSSSGTKTLSFALQVGNCTGPTPGGTSAGTGGTGSTSGGGSGALAFTGGNTGLLVGIGAALLLIGGTLFVSTRRKRAAQHTS